MNAKRAPYARSSVWYTVIALGLVLVIAFVAVGVEIVHMRSQVNTLQNQVTQLNLLALKLIAQGK